MRKGTLRERMHQYYLEQVQWVKDCGGDLAGYIQKYHIKHGRTIENTVAIYDADINALKGLEKYK